MQIAKGIVYFQYRRFKESEAEFEGIILFEKKIRSLNFNIIEN